MDLKNFDWKGLVGSVAPLLATALGGPLAGVATSAISGALLGHGDGTEQDIATVLATNKYPELFVKLKQADQVFAVKMKELDIDVEKLNIENTKDARSRQVEMVKAGARDYTQDILAYVAIVGFFAVLYALFVRTLPEGLPRDAFLILLGTLTKIVSDLYNYYFGSSKGSKDKTILMAERISR